MRNNQNRTYSKNLGETVTQADYQSFKKLVMGGNATRKSIPLTEFVIKSEEVLIVRGVPMEMTKEAFSSLRKFLKIGSATYKDINKTIDNGQDINLSILCAMQMEMAKDVNNNSICIIIDNTSLKIINFVKSAQGVLSNQSFLELFEDTMSNHSNMVIKNLAVNEGIVEISVINNDWEFDVDGMKDEFFKSGVVFINTPDSTIINPFNERLVCTNGMVVSESGMSLILKKGGTEKETNVFFDNARNLKGFESFGVKFKKRIIHMMNTTASYKELHNATAAMFDAVDSSDPSVKETIDYYMCNNEIKRAYLKHNIDLTMLDQRQWARIYTMHTVWDLVNHLTELSSHPVKHGLSLKEGNTGMFTLQKNAGELAFKEIYDLESPIQLFK